MLHATTLLSRLTAAGLVTSAHRVDAVDAIDHLAHDSRLIAADGCFFALRGTQADGHSFIDKAVSNGAIAVVCTTLPEEMRARHSGVAFIRVTDARAAMAEAAAAFHGDPADRLRMIGVTGTNGKTTVAYLLHHLLEALGERAGLVGTVAYRFGGLPVPATRTTPDALELHWMLREMVDAGCTACVMEASSHALDQRRTWGLPFSAALFTNLTQDHLDYHGSMAAYREAKRRLFTELPSNAVAVYNSDDDAGAAMVDGTPARTRSFGTGADADVQFEVRANAQTGLRLRLRAEGTTYERSFRLAGGFNAYNLAGAYAAATALGYAPDAVLDALAQAPPIPGRFERLQFGDGTTAIVDYAHTPDALKKVLVTARDILPDGAALWCIFGCGGDRDRDKRPQMGAVAEAHADHVIVTSDNPRTEPPAQIMSDIHSGFDAPEAAWWIEDREAAIARAAAEAAPGDVVVVAGKGHETTQMVGEEKRTFDDREVVRRLFEHRTA